MEPPTIVEELCQPHSVWKEGQETYELSADLQNYLDVYPPVQSIRIERIGSRNDTLLVVKLEDCRIFVRTGCFLGTLDTFEQAVHRRYDSDVRSLYNNQARHYEMYLKAIEFIRVLVAEPVAASCP